MEELPEPPMLPLEVAGTGELRYVTYEALDYITEPTFLDDDYYLIRCPECGHISSEHGVFASHAREDHSMHYSRAHIGSKSFTVSFDLIVDGYPSSADCLEKLQEAVSLDTYDLVEFDIDTDYDIIEKEVCVSGVVESFTYRGNISNERLTSSLRRHIDFEALTNVDVEESHSYPRDLPRGTETLEHAKEGIE